MRVRGTVTHPQGYEAQNRSYSSYVRMLKKRAFPAKRTFLYALPTLPTDVVDHDQLKASGFFHKSKRDLGR